MKLIILEMKDDHVEPYASREYNKIPFVKYSTHPRFTEGTRFHYGFLQVSLQEGYAIVIIPFQDFDQQPTSGGKTQ